jgi:hypothetical protein
MIICPIKRALSIFMMNFIKISILGEYERTEHQYNFLLINSKTPQIKIQKYIGSASSATFMSDTALLLNYCLIAK